MSSNRVPFVVEKKVLTNQVCSALEEVHGNSSEQIIDSVDQKKLSSLTKSPRKGMPQQIKSPKKAPVKLNFDNESVSVQTEIEKAPQISPRVSPSDMQSVDVSSSKNTALVVESPQKNIDIDSDEEIHEELKALNKTAQEINYIPNRKRPREDESTENKIIKRARWDSKNQDDSQDEDQNESREDEEMQSSAHAPSMPILPQVVLNPPIRPIPRIPVPFNLAQFGIFQGIKNQNQQSFNHYYGNLSDQASPLNCDRGFIARKLF